ncbi:hypothetical protein ACH5RR_034958 [Cinchona calisaya]|uniref:Alcohol dehydrogenase-like N-terminal domain-containing protein n=1 Tax=Cinchona calisaya TaxID=153742 RepID=A0ABD2YFG2_9GENT
MELESCFEQMEVVVIGRAGGPIALKRLWVPYPEIGDDEVLVDVSYIGVNRIDIEQRLMGLRMPNGDHNCPGVEISGRIAALGNNVVGWKQNQEVCVVLNGGGYAEKVAVSSRLLLPVPFCHSLSEAACLPMAACTVWRAFFLGNLDKGKRILVIMTFMSCK